MYEFKVGDIVAPTVGLVGSTQLPHFLLVKSVYSNTFVCLNLITGLQTSIYITKNYYKLVA